MDSKGIVPCLSSDSVEIHREEEAFSLISLVADIGGILGLFIGFNFLMVWDWIVWAIQKLWQSQRVSISVWKSQLHTSIKDKLNIPLSKTWSMRLCGTVEGCTLPPGPPHPSIDHELEQSCCTLCWAVLVLFMMVLRTVSVSLIPDKTQQRSHFPPCVNTVLFFSRGAFMKHIIRHQSTIRSWI